MTESQPLTFIEHLEELRARLLWCLAAYMAAFLLCYSQTTLLLRLVMRPLRVNFPEIRLTALTITESFFTTMKLAAWAGLIVVFPVLVWHVWQFVSPGLLPRERRFAAWSLLPMLLLFVAGCCACYFGFLPFILKLMISGMGSDLNANFSYAAYVDFILVSLMISGILCELPLLLVFLDATSIWTVEQAVAYRRHGIVIAFVIGGIFSPPDVISQFLVTIPLLLLMEIGIRLAFFCRNFRTSTVPADE